MEERTLSAPYANEEAVQSRIDQEKKARLNADLAQLRKDLAEAKLTSPQNPALHEHLANQIEFLTLKLKEI